ncbi:TonB-dependent receptor [Granulicella sp. dw_53]|uniref:TonB-dependent receptor domain-containing protein n=1 Tax=Granulicella sp. dw_53 TaxID=2719792 RepID=UPI001BD2A5F1|nr:TonB-dependent receptor [Granulicella sp. dw_53]
MSYSKCAHLPKALQSFLSVSQNSATKLVIGLFLLAIGCFLLPQQMQAQMARLTGAVTDSAGLAVSDANISVRNIDTGIHRESNTNSSGGYDVSSLQLGHYTVRAEKPGFEALQRSGITLSVDTTTRLDLMLSVGKTSETISVNGAANLLQPNSPEFESFVTSQQFDDLPLVQQDRMRNPASFVYLTPGVQGNIAVNGSEYVGATNVILANGGQMYSTELLLEGLPGGQSRVPGNYTESAPSVDAIAEFKMTTTLLSAEYGHTGAAVGSFSVKSGTNNFHGSAYEYIRNSALDATNWLAKHTNTVQKLSKKQNEFGATIGGPIRIPHLYDGRDKTFFFFAYGGSRLYGGAASFTTVLVPTVAQRGGDFGTTNIYDPATTTPTGTTYTRKQFAGNKIDPSRFDPMAQKVLAYIPLPNLPGNGNNYGAYTGASILIPDTYTGKIDHMISSRQALGAVYIRTSIPRTTIGSPLPKPIGGNSYQVVASHTIRLNHNWTLSPNLLNSASAGFNRFTNANLPLYQDQNYTEAIGLKGIPDSTYFPTLTFSSGFAPISSINNANVPENGYYFKDRMTWNVGRHLVKFGGEYRILQYNDHNPFKFAGTFGFNSLSTANPTNSSGGNGFASFLLGQAFSGTVTGPAIVYTRKRYSGFFVQDDFRFNERLTFNLGLRYEWQNSPREAQNNHSAIDLSLPNPGAGNLPGALAFASASRQTFFATDYSAISPRFGFAFKALPTMVVRGGYGIYYTDTMPNLALNRSGYSVSGTFSSPNNGATPAFVLKDGVPQTYPTVPTLTPTALNGQAGSYYQSNTGAMPRIQEWSLSIQKSFGANASLEAIYIGNHGTRLVDPQMVNINQLDPKYASLGSLLTQSATSSAAVTAGVKLPYPGFTGSVAQALRPYPQYQDLTSIAAKAGSNIYHAGQIVYRQRIGGGLTFFGGYTWSKNLGYSSPNLDGSGATNNVLQNSYNPRAEYGLLPQDVKQAVILNYVYSFPFGSGKKFLTHGIGNAILGGWKISGVHRYQSGTPLSILAANNTSQTFFNRFTRPNRVPGADPTFRGGKFNYDTDRRINPAAFSQPANFTFGNAAPTYGNLRNFASFTEDMALVKETQIFEKMRWSFYAQTNNTFNRHRFYGIQTNIDSATFGKPSNVSNPRYLQFGTRVRF